MRIESLFAGLVEPLDDHGDALAAANAHGFQVHGLVPGGQAVEQGGGDPGAGHAERVAQGDGAAVHVEPVDVDAELAVGGDDLRRERLVDLDQVDVGDGHADPPHRLPGRLDGAQAH